MMRFVLWLAGRYHEWNNPHGWRSMIDLGGTYRIEISRRIT